MAWHAAILLLVAGCYMFVRIVWAPTSGFGRYHVTDLLAGVALPSLFALVLWPSNPIGVWARTLAGKLALVGSAALVWEVFVPLFSARSTADPADVLSYAAGTLLQHGASRLVSPRIVDRHEIPATPTACPRRRQR